jgi:hypothetical protein
MLKDKIAKYFYRCCIFLHNFVFWKNHFLKFSRFLQITWALQCFINTSDDQLTQGQNINILRIYLNKIFNR